MAGRKTTTRTHRAADERARKDGDADTPPDTGTPTPIATYPASGPSTERDKFPVEVRPGDPTLGDPATYAVDAGDAHECNAPDCRRDGTMDGLCPAHLQSQRGLRDRAVRGE